MCAAEGGEEVVQPVLVGDVDGRKLETDSVLVAAENIVVPYRQVEEISRLDALRVMVVLFCSRRWYFD